VYQTRFGETSYVQTGLNMSAVYQFRLRAATTKTGFGQRGPAVTVTTRPYTVNPWQQVYARGISENNAGGGRRYVDPPTDEVAMLPRYELGRDRLQTWPSWPFLYRWLHRVCTPSC
jgi:hypothetical protein